MTISPDEAPIEVPSILPAVLLTSLLLATVGAARGQPADAGEPAESNQASLSGSVVDQATGDPVPGAIVSTGSLETTTADDGRFELAGAPSGWIDLVVVADGYEPLVQRVRRGLVARLLVAHARHLWS